MGPLLPTKFLDQVAAIKRLLTASRAKLVSETRGVSTAGIPPKENVLPQTITQAKLKPCVLTRANVLRNVFLSMKMSVAFTLTGKRITEKCLHNKWNANLLIYDKMQLCKQFLRRIQAASYSLNPIKISQLKLLLVKSKNQIITTLLDTWSGRSFTTSRYSIGPKLEPWGAPL